MTRSEQKKAMRDEIVNAIDGICFDIANNACADDNAARAAAIKILVEVYKELR